MYRGSTSSQARAYKKAGHANENNFGSIIGGTNEGLNPQGKTDWKDSDNRTYTVKTGHGCKKWQVFLYGFERISNDEDFSQMGRVGNLLVSALNSFPKLYSNYLEDKVKVKEFLQTLIADDRSGLSLLSDVREKFEGRNSYLDSKLALSKVTSELSKELSELEIRKAFLRKSMFNNTEVEFLAISQPSSFEIYPRELVVESFGNRLTPSTSVSGNNPLDLNVPGQKILLKGSRNIVEIEIRNDSEKHYREVRFNMLTAPAIQILKETSRPKNETAKGKITWMGPSKGH
jgi:hypothetical protein